MKLPPSQLVLPLIEELDRRGGDARPRDLYDPIAERLGRRWISTEMSAAYLDNHRIRMQAAGITTEDHCT